MMCIVHIVYNVMYILIVQQESPRLKVFFFNSRDNKLLNGAHGEDGKVVRRHIFNRIGAIRFLGRARSKIFGN
jgi:hypothetical protein